MAAGRSPRQARINSAAPSSVKRCTWSTSPFRPRLRPGLARRGLPARQNDAATPGAPGGLDPASRQV